MYIISSDLSKDRQLAAVSLFKEQLNGTFL
jgi:hypothetical protein